jgi:DNA-binding NarL/FixJ family response regulator
VVSARDGAAGLSGRQIEVLRAMAEGLTYQEIGRRLRISHRTVEEHVATIRRHLRTRSVGDTIARAFELGLLEVGERPDAPDG